MDVACSTLCFSREPFEQALRHIAELEFGKVDLAVCADGPHLTPREIADNPTEVLHRIRQGPTIGFAALTVRNNAGADGFDEQLDAVAHLAKQLTAPVVVIDAAPVGSPLDAEIDRLTRLTKMVSTHGVILTVVTKTGTLTERPGPAVELCRRVPGLGLTLDPSHYICGPHQNKKIDDVYPHVQHVQLRDSGRRMDQIQVKIGGGDVEFGKVVGTLELHKYRGSLAVMIEDALAGDMDVEAEVRKLRLVLESLV